MPQNQRKIEGNPVKCIGCGRQIAKGFIIHGMIQIPCKCGVMNTIEAEHKPEGRKYFIDHEPGFDSRGRMAEVSMVLRKTS